MWVDLHKYLATFGDVRSMALFETAYNEHCRKSNIHPSYHHLAAMSLPLCFSNNRWREVMRCHLVLYSSSKKKNLGREIKIVFVSIVLVCISNRT